MLTIYERSKSGRYSDVLPTSDTPDYKISDAYLRKESLVLPEVSEIDFVRHYTELAKHAFGVDDGFYPLGSCTMKYNPKINEITSALDGFCSLHPLTEERNAQGALRLMYELQQALKAITGMSDFTLQPAAGAHGEYTGLMLIRAYHLNRGESFRTKIIVPDSAHGTNPASSSLSGFTIVNIPSTADGNVDLDALQKELDENTAGLMLTNPNTLGKFDKNIAKITELVHNAGGLCYYDGANLNAVMGVVRPADMGFDVVHLNLHKTFSTPHGGGGPGSGPVGCVSKLKDFLPTPVIAEKDGRYYFETPIYSIGKVKAFYGNFSVMIRAFTYILILGKSGIKNASNLAVLNANYLKKLLGTIDFKAGEYCQHEFVLSMEELHEKTGVSALDIAKAMIDCGIHPPTMYFPLIVHEALMFEPTETESKETLDKAAEVVLSIIERCKSEPEKVKSSPNNAYIARPDEVQAARNPKLKIG